jgi:hypothetical protein
MFFGYNLQEILMFPIKDKESRKHFYVGIAISLLAFIIPIAPYFILFGYGAQIAKQILNGKSPRMVAWTDWGKLFKDGAKVFATRFLLGLPILVFFVPIIVVSFMLPFIAETANPNEFDPFFLTYILVLFGSMCFIIPIALIVGVIIPAAETHVIEKDNFSALFQFREWWQIFRANLGGFIVAYIIYYLITLILTFVFQILFASIILAFLAFIAMPALTIYITVIMYVLGAMAYKDGKAKLEQPAS